MTINDKTNLSSVLYWSGGSGGGTGTYGRIPTLDADGKLGGENYKFYYGRGPVSYTHLTLPTTPYV